MSNFRHPAGPTEADALAVRTLAVRSLAVRYSAGTHLAAHAHDWDQLLYASEGVMTVATDEGRWVVPTHRAVWIPAGVSHAIDCSGRVFLRTLYLRPGLRSDSPAKTTVVSVEPLLRELVLRAVTWNALDEDVPAHRHLLACLLDQLEGIDSIAVSLPLPRDPGALRVAQRIQEEPGSDEPIDRAARSVGMSRRTLERRFANETGMTLGRWRQQARLLNALTRLAAGATVTEVALEIGYATPSGFVAAFRAAFGTTPARFFRPDAPNLGVDASAGRWPVLGS